MVSVVLSGFRRISVIPSLKFLPLRASVFNYSSHHHEEPPHYAYRGDGLPDVKCEELQHMLHLNQKLTEKTAQQTEKFGLQNDNLGLQREKTGLQSDKMGFKTEKTGLQMEKLGIEGVDGQTEEVYNELKNLFARVLLSNWHDTVQLTMNMDIWAGNFDRLRRVARDIPHVKLQQLLTETKELFDVLYQVEDLQDHLYELMEELALNPEVSGTFGGTNYNLHINEVVKRYHELKKSYPEYTQKLKESLGYTLAIMRQRYTFNWPEEHSYFY
ncbi:hypothetical protein TpMuguga_02g02010 [Theileria parva strain Muguga]|uniref:uncharacterized protein n=1 Tax=Theileria parva strain Muguga TaxID=333668 RepID=UPI001C619A50|nr:uncharacterized protein TpMuguga_02g02010 [Theileria parva strain Muguga]KAF5153662.1 hypothetical protein TpMuguga_02g02010 [Theileria parva strain Muguga]